VCVGGGGGSGPGDQVESWMLGTVERPTGRIPVGAFPPFVDRQIVDPVLVFGRDDVRRRAKETDESSCGVVGASQCAGEHMGIADARKPFVTWAGLRSALPQRSERTLQPERP
jgi:hypothetical protein